MKEINYLEEFDKIFKQQGGLYDYKRVDNIPILKDSLPIFNKLINNIKKPDSKLPSVYINYVDNPTLNAVVSKNENGYFIGINYGTVFLLLDLFLRMLSCPKVLTEYGNPKLEETKKIFNPGLDSLDQLYLAKDPDESVRPKDIQRYKVAMLLTTFALNFLVMHEYAHIIYGHVDYVGNTTSIFSIPELNYNTPYTKIDSLFSQTLEMDADCFGVSIGMQQLFNGMKSSNEEFNEYHYIFSDITKSQKLWMFSIYSMFRIWGYKENKLTALLSHTHPPSGIRQFMILSTMYSIYEKHGHSNIIEKWSEEVPKVIEEVEKAFTEISFQQLNVSAFALAISDEGRKHVNLLMENWKNVRPFLEKFATGNLAPIA